jgi:hypothetical protein
MRRNPIALGLTLVLAACAADSGNSVQVVRSWSHEGTAHYDLDVDGTRRHVASTPQRDGLTVLVSDEAGDIVGGAQRHDEEAFVLATEPDAAMSEIPASIDDESALALELALAGELPDLLGTRADNFPDTMPLTCTGQCAADRDACSGGSTSGVVVALCNWIYQKCIASCSTWGGGGGGVFLP